jgi:hypothetical protein
MHDGKGVHARAACPAQSSQHALPCRRALLGASTVQRAHTDVVTHTPFPARYEVVCANVWAAGNLRTQLSRALAPTRSPAPQSCLDDSSPAYPALDTTCPTVLTCALACLGVERSLVLPRTALGPSTSRADKEARANKADRHRRDGAQAPVPRPSRKGRTF